MYTNKLYLENIVCKLITNIDRKQSAKKFFCLDLNCFQVEIGCISLCISLNWRTRKTQRCLWVRKLLEERSFHSDILLAKLRVVGACLHYFVWMSTTDKYFYKWWYSGSYDPPICFIYVCRKIISNFLHSIHLPRYISIIYSSYTGAKWNYSTRPGLCIHDHGPRRATVCGIPVNPEQSAQWLAPVPNDRCRAAIHS